MLFSATRQSGSNKNKPNTKNTEQDATNIEHKTVAGPGFDLIAWTSSTGRGFYA